MSESYDELAQQIIEQQEREVLAATIAEVERECMDEIEFHARTAAQPWNQPKQQNYL